MSWNKKDNIKLLEYDHFGYQPVLYYFDPVIAVGPRLSGISRMSCYSTHVDHVLLLLIYLGLQYYITGYGGATVIQIFQFIMTVVFYV